MSCISCWFFKHLRYPKPKRSHSDTHWVQFYSHLIFIQQLEKPTDHLKNAQGAIQNLAQFSNPLAHTPLFNIQEILTLC